MTKEEAIKFIENCSDQDYCGFFVCAVSREDFSFHEFANKNLEKLDEMNPEEKESYLSDVAESMEYIYNNEHFKDDFKKVMEYE